MNKRNYKGITLIALVITIIVLLILAGVSIQTLVGENGIINRVSKTKESMLIAREKEEIKLAIGGALIDGDGILIDGYLRNEIKSYDNLKIENLSGNNPWLYQGKKTYTIDKYGTVLEGIYSVWDGHSQEMPDIRSEKGKYNWYIYTCAQFKFLEQFVNNGYKLTDEQKDLINDSYSEEDFVLNEESTVFLMSNLDLGARELNDVWENDENKGREWIPIGKILDCKFTATFEGNHFIINGVYINADSNTVGVFGYTRCIKNVTVQNSYIEGRTRTGSVAGYSEYMYDCHNINTEVTLKEGEYHTVGGIVGYFSGELLSKCTNNGKVNAKGKSASDNSQAGGIVGYVTNISLIEECENYGEIRAIGNRVGGIAGQNNAKGINKCINYGEIYSDGMYVGGISGMAYGTDAENFMKIKDCENNANVQGGAVVGGITGHENNNTDIENCKNTGDIKSGGLTSITSNSAGGIAGSGYGAIKECTNSGKVEANQAHRWNRAGGIVGWYRSKFERKANRKMQ